jgi:hypothetical protein
MKRKKERKKERERERGGREGGRRPLYSKKKAINVISIGGLKSISAIMNLSANMHHFYLCNLPL